MSAGGSDWLPLTCFRLQGANASQFRAEAPGLSGSPSTIRASRYGGTGAMTTPASVASDIDRSNSITVAMPATLTTDVPPISRFVLRKAGRASLTGIRRVYLFDTDAQSFGFVRDELGELEEGPR